jgi:hypothetical protein
LSWAFSTRRLAWFTACLSGVWLSSAGCRPGVGSSCEKGEARCLDSGRALACEGGQFIEVPCRGPKGCAAGANSIACDIQRSRSGDRCSRDEEGTAVCADEKRIMACRSGRFVSSPCRGPKGCALLGDRALCDTSVGILAEACREDGKKACAADGSAVLACKQHALAPLYLCRGPKGCALKEGKLDCDMSVAVERDACDPRQEGHVACSPDHTATLICKSGRFTSDEKCKRGTTCVAEEKQTRCSKIPS